ncbi:MAG: PhnD/SsuA/transferrin family substrate-binding protein [Actinomycetota bacterium]
MSDPAGTPARNPGAAPGSASTPRRLTAATFLGDNTVEPMRRLVNDLSHRGLDVELQHLGDRSTPNALAKAADVDLLWMCGGLVVEQQAAGALAHDVVAAPVFTDQPGPVYHSVIVARHDGPKTTAEALGGPVAINEPQSWSGHRALRRHLSPIWFATEMISGSHRESLAAVAEGRALCAGIDHSIWTATPEPSLVVIDRTTDWPAPPVLIRRGLPAATVETITAALIEFTDDGVDRTVDRFVPAETSDYEVMG